MTDDIHSPNATVYIAACTMAAGIGLLAAAIAIPPPGEIHNSILLAFGEISTFCATLLGFHRFPAKKRSKPERDNDYYK